MNYIADAGRWRKHDIDHHYGLRGIFGWRKISIQVPGEILNVPPGNRDYGPGRPYFPSPNRPRFELAPGGDRRVIKTSHPPRRIVFSLGPPSPQSTPV